MMEQIGPLTLTFAPGATDAMLTTNGDWPNMDIEDLEAVVNCFQRFIDEVRERETR